MGLVGGHFQPAPRVEARRPCIGIRQRLRLARCVVQVGPFRFEEGEVAHVVWLIRASKLRTASMILTNDGGSVKNIGRIA